jgi:DNA-binding NarL/FixJ family response regulator
MAEKTVKNHVSALLRKLSVERRTQLVLVSERRRHGVPRWEPAAPA